MDPITEYIKKLFQGQSWLLLIGVAGLIFRSTIEKITAAIFVFFGNDYNEDDIVYLNSKPARIVRVGLLKTTFFIYEVKEGKVIGGKKLVIQNEKLSGLNIEKPLQKIEFD